MSDPGAGIAGSSTAWQPAGQLTLMEAVEMGRYCGNSYFNTYDTRANTMPNYLPI